MGGHLSLVCRAVQEMGRKDLLLVLWVVGMVVQVIMGAEYAKIWVLNQLHDSVALKINDGAGIWKSEWHTKMNVTEFSLRSNCSKSFKLMQTSKGYLNAWPWFLWVGLHTNSSSSQAYVLDPYAESPSHPPNKSIGGCSWEFYGKGIFYTRTDATRSTVATHPTRFCKWNQTPNSDRYSEPAGTYDSHQPLYHCSAYSAPWSSIPVWISLYNRLQTDVKVTLSKGDETSIQLDVSKMDNGLAGHASRVISGSSAEYRLHEWTMMVQVRQDPSRNFNVTMRDPLRLKEGEELVGAIFRFRNATISVVRVNGSWDKGKAKKVCTWLEQDATEGLPYCKRPIGV